MSAFLSRRWCSVASQLRCRADWPAFAGADWAQQIMSVAVTDLFHAKQGRSTGRWILSAGGRRLSVYLKRHYVLSWWRGFLAMLWPGGAWSPGLQEWHNLEWAKAEGFPVPEPVAAGEFLGPRWRLQSFLAVEELAGMLPLHQAVPAAEEALDAATFAHWKCGLIHEMARLTRELHCRGRFHKDLYLCHFYIPAGTIVTPPKEWAGRVYLIDLHRLAQHAWTGWLWQVKDLAQLLYSSEIAGVMARDRLRFWRCYRKGGRSRWLRWAILVKWRRYRQHNQARIGAKLPWRHNSEAAKSAA